jgi:hypothetical protein
MSILELEEAIQRDIIGRLPPWPYLTARYGVQGVCKAWRTLILSSPDLHKSAHVREAPVAAGVRQDASDGHVTPYCALGFTPSDLASLNTSFLVCLGLHDVVGISFGQALCFAAQCRQLQRLTLERLGNGKLWHSKLRGEDLELPLQACLHLKSVRIVGAAGHNLDIWSFDESSSLASIGRLESLCIIDCDGMGPQERQGFNNDNLISKVAQAMSESLVELDLSGTGYPSNHACKLVESFLSRLETLYLSGGTSQCGGSITDR